jgi:hypothetical protein
MPSTGSRRRPAKTSAKARAKKSVILSAGEMRSMSPESKDLEQLRGLDNRPATALTSLRETPRRRPLDAAPSRCPRAHRLQVPASAARARPRPAALAAEHAEVAAISHRTKFTSRVILSEVSRVARHAVEGPDTLSRTARWEVIDDVRIPLAKNPCRVLRLHARRALRSG